MVIHSPRRILEFAMFSHDCSSTRYCLENRLFCCSCSRWPKARCRDQRVLSTAEHCPPGTATISSAKQVDRVPSRTLLLPTVYPHYPHMKTAPGEAKLSLTMNVRAKGHGMDLPPAHPVTNWQTSRTSWKIRSQPKLRCFMTSPSRCKGYRRNTSHSPHVLH